MRDDDSAMLARYLFYFEENASTEFICSGNTIYLAVGLSSVCPLIAACPAPDLTM